MDNLSIWPRVAMSLADMTGGMPSSLSRTLKASWLLWTVLDSSSEAMSLGHRSTDSSYACSYYLNSLRAVEEVKVTEKVTFNVSTMSTVSESASETQDNALVLDQLCCCLTVCGARARSPELRYSHEVWSKVVDEGTQSQARPPGLSQVLHLHPLVPACVLLTPFQQLIKTC